MKMKILPTLLLFLLPLISICGDYLWQAQINKIDKADYYNIALPPHYIAKLQKNYADLRILDSSNITVPYFIPAQNTFTLQNYYTQLPIISQENVKKNNFNSFLRWKFRNGFTRIIIENTNKEVISDLDILISNTDIEKTFWLSGSNNKKEWFSIKNKFAYRATYFDETHSEIQLHNLPKTDYRYYELIVSDVFHNPIEIKKIGYYSFRKKENTFSRIADSVITLSINEGKKATSYKVQLPEEYETDKIVFNVKRPRHYYRKAYVYEIDSFLRKKEYVHSERIMYSFTLSSQSNNEIYLSGYKSKTILIRVINDDNPPLKMDGINLYTFQKYATAFLEKGSYHLFLGNDGAEKPKYDIAHFQNSVPDSIAELIPYNLRALKTKEEIKESNPIFSGILLWIIIAVVAVILLLVSFKLLGEMKTEK